MGGLTATMQKIGEAKGWFIVFDVDSNYQQCESQETVVNLFMQVVFTDDGG